MNSIAAFAMGLASRDEPARVFDWEKAEAILTERGWPDAEAGLAENLEWTAGCIVQNGAPHLDSYTYLASTWATPVLIIDGEEIECWRMQDGIWWGAHTKWPSKSKPVS